MIHRAEPQQHVTKQACSYEDLNFQNTREPPGPSWLPPLSWGRGETREGASICPHHVTWGFQV